MPKPSSSSKAKPPSKIKRMLLCDLGGRRSKKSSSTGNQGTIKPLASQTAKPAHSAKVPRQAGRVPQTEPKRSAVTPIAAPPVKTGEARPKMVRSPTPVPSMTAAIRTPSISGKHPKTSPVAARPMPCSWDTSSSETARTVPAAASPSSPPRSSFYAPAQATRKPSYAAPGSYRPAQARQSYSYAPTSVYSSYDYGSSSYGGSSDHGGSSSGGGYGGDSGGGGSCGGGGGDGGGGGGC